MTEVNQSTPSAESGEQPHTVDEAVKAVEAEEAQPQEPEIDVDNTSIDDLVNMEPEKLQALLESEPSKEGEEEKEVAQPEGVEPQKKPGKVDMIPKPRFDEVLVDRNKLEEENLALKEKVAFLSGVAAGAKVAESKPATPSVDPIQEVVAKIQELDATVERQILDASAAFDAGDIGMADYEKKKASILKNASIIKGGLYKKRDNLIAERNRPSPEQVLQQIEGDPDLQAATRNLVADNPWLSDLPDAQYDDLAELAVIRLKKQGYEIRQDSETQWNIRWTIAQMGKELGLDRLYSPSVSTPAPKTNGYTPTPNEVAKKKMAAQQPPIPTLGGVTAPVKINENIDVDKATIDELANLPASTLQKMAGLS